MLQFPTILSNGLTLKHATSPGKPTIPISPSCKQLLTPLSFF